MCIIALCQTRKPSLDELKNCEKSNNHGAGIAWIKDGIVHWRKGIDDIEKHYNFIKKLPLPILIHFRLASSGSVCRELTHPFPIESDVPLALKGETKNGVIAHNGTWREFKEYTLAAILSNKKLKPLKGQISDSRYIAWFVYHYGIEILNLFDCGKIVLFTPKKIETIGQFYEHDGILYSNFEYQSSRSIFTFNSDRTCPYKNRNNYENCVIKSYQRCNYINSDCPFGFRNFYH